MMMLYGHGHRLDIIVVNYGISELVLLLSSDNDTFTVKKYSTRSNSYSHYISIFLGLGDGNVVRRKILQFH